MTGPFARPPEGLGQGGDDLRLQAAGAGVTYRELDLRAVRGNDDLMRALDGDLALPPYFGRNLDALMDVLTDPGVFPPRLAIGLCGLTALRRAHPKLAAALRDTLLDAQREAAAAGRAIYLLQLDAPTRLD